MHTFSDVLGHFWCRFAPFCHPAVLCVLLLAQFTGSAVFPLQDAAGQTSLGWLILRLRNVPYPLLKQKSRNPCLSSTRTILWQ